MSCVHNISVALLTTNSEIKWVHYLTVERGGERLQEIIKIFSRLFSYYLSIYALPPFGGLCVKNESRFCCSRLIVVCFFPVYYNDTGWIILRQNNWPRLAALFYYHFHAMNEPFSSELVLCPATLLRSSKVEVTAWTVWNISIRIRSKQKQINVRNSFQNEKYFKFLNFFKTEVEVALKDKFISAELANRLNGPLDRRRILSKWYLNYGVAGSFISCGFHIGRYCSRSCWCCGRELRLKSNRSALRWEIRPEQTHALVYAANFNQFAE